MIRKVTDPSPFEVIAGGVRAALHRSGAIHDYHEAEAAELILSELQRHGYVVVAIERLATALADHGIELEVDMGTGMLPLQVEH